MTQNPPPKTLDNRLRLKLYAFVQEFQCFAFPSRLGGVAGCVVHEVVVVRRNA